MLRLYNLILVPTAVLLAPVALVVVLCSARARRGLAERLWPRVEMPEPSVWVHAASVGEVEAAAPLIEALLERGIPTFATTLTTSGRDRLRARLPELWVGLAPLDLPGLVSLVVRRARATVLVLVETELWPNLIHAVASRGGASGGSQRAALRCELPALPPRPASARARISRALDAGRQNPGGPRALRPSWCGPGAGTRRR